MKSRFGMQRDRAPAAWQDNARPLDDLPDTANETQETPVLVDAAERFLANGSESLRDQELDTAWLVQRLKAPDPGIEVVEDRAGSAFGQWVLHVRCECGRRWFELDAVKASTCPRCGVLVYVEIDVPDPLM